MNKKMPTQWSNFLCLLLGMWAALGIGLSGAGKTASAQTISDAKPTTAVADNQSGHSAGLSLASPLGKEVLSEHWYIVELAGQRAGWLHSIDSRDTQANRRYSQSHMQMTIRRGDFTLAIQTQSQSIETLQGQPVQLTSVQMISNMQTMVKLDFDPKEIIMTTTRGQQTSRQVMPLSQQKWMPPGQLSDYLARELQAGKKLIQTWSIEPSLGPDPFETTLVVKGQENVTVMGKVVPSLVMQTTSTKTPGVESIIYTNDQGEPLKMSMSIGSISLNIIESDQALALSPMDPPQLLAAMLITPQKRVENSRTSRLAIYELQFGDSASKPKSGVVADLDQQRSSLPNSPMKLPDGFLPSSGYQRVVWTEQGVAKVVIDLDHPVPPASDLPTPQDRAASPILDTNDEQIQRLARQALAHIKADANAATKAEACRKFVYDYIDKKDLSVGFASASEVARTAQGDCTEHAVLLVAILRVVGIPSRTVSGVVYADQFEGHQGIFGYHLWTRAWLDTGPDSTGRWVDLDATLDPVHPFDATHIAFGTSNLSQKTSTNDMLLLAPTMGRLKISPILVEQGQ